MPLIVDAHEDLAWNMMCYARDYNRSAYDTRAEEADGQAKQIGSATIGLPEWLKGNVGVVFGTVFSMPEHSKMGSRSITYTTADEAHQSAMQQIDLYRRFADENDQVRLVHTQSDLDAVLATWEPLPKEGASLGGDQQVGIVLLMENADPIRTPEEVELWYEHGLRLIGPAWTASRYSAGTGAPGPLSDDGFQLLEHMQELNMALDTSHMAEQAFFQALDHYDGPIIASHSNPRHYVESDRHLSDEMINTLVERDGVIGTVLFNMFLKEGWRMGDSRDTVDVNTVVRAIDYVCQRAGDAKHAGIGTDFDGGFGSEAIPAGLDTVADLSKVADGLQQAGYESVDIDAVMGGNWLRVLRQCLPR